MRRVSLTVTSLAVAGAAAMALGPASALAASESLDVSAHFYSFDHTLADGSGGPDAVVHGSVPFVSGRLDPPGAGDAAVRFDGRSTDHLSIARPVFDYGTADFTLDLWLSTNAKTAGTILDTGGTCEGSGGGFALVISPTGRLSVRIGQAREDGGSEASDSPPPDGNGTGGPGGDGTGTSATGEDSATVQSPAVRAFLHAIAARNHPAHAATAGGATPLTAGLPGATPLSASPPETHPAAEDHTPGPRANDGHWHEATLIRTGTTFLVRLDTTIEQTLTLRSNADLDGSGEVRIGRGWCGDDHAFDGKIDDLRATPVPPAALPESPVVAILPVSAATIGAVFLARRQSRRRRRPDAPRG